jgi:hypothetical protein
MKLKEFIKQLVRDVLDEDGGASTTGGSGSSSMSGGPGMNYATPAAFAKKGQKTNRATKEAEKMGWTKAKKPKTSKVVDYKKIWKESDYDKASISSQASGYTAASGYTGVGGDDHENEYYKESMNNIQDIIKEELLKEGTYKQFKSEVKYRTKAEQLHKAMREVKRKLSEIDRIVEYTHRMKQELSEGDGVQYWGRTEKAVAQISEMVNHLNNKINNLKQ